MAGLENHATLEINLLDLIYRKFENKEKALDELSNRNSLIPMDATFTVLLNLR